MVNKKHDPADYIVPLSIGGLEGRMLHIPADPETVRNAASKPELLFVYGHHSSLERWWGLSEVFSRYSAVTMPDLPGFGGMDSFYKLGQEPTIDAMADYLAAFMKWRYKRKKVVIAGLSYGFVVATRMLQRYPELTGKVTMLISIVGFAHKDDFVFPRWKYRLMLGTAKFLQLPLPAMLTRALILNRPVLSTIYRISENEKFKGADSERFKHLIDVEVGLWRDNDLRTAMRTLADFLRIDNCKKQIDLPVYHIAVDGDRYIDNHMVEQHLRIIFSDYHQLAKLDMVSHAPSVIATAEEAEGFLPKSLLTLLRDQ